MSAWGTSPQVRLAQEMGVCSSAALCPYPLFNQAWVSIDLMVPPSWAFLVTEGREER